MGFPTQCNNKQDVGCYATSSFILLEGYASVAATRLITNFPETGRKSFTKIVKLFHVLKLVKTVKNDVSMDELFLLILLSASQHAAQYVLMSPSTGFSVVNMLVKNSSIPFILWPHRHKGLESDLLDFLVCEVVSSKVPVIVLEFPGDLFMLVLPEVLKNFTASTRPSP